MITIWIMSVVLGVPLLAGGIWLIARLSKKIGVVAACSYVLSMPFALLATYSLLGDLSYSIYCFEIKNSDSSTLFSNSTILYTVFYACFLLIAIISQTLHLKRKRNSADKLKK